MMEEGHCPRWQTGGVPAGEAVVYEHYEYNRRYIQIGRGGDISAEVARWVTLDAILKLLDGGEK